MPNAARVSVFAALGLAACTAGPASEPIPYTLEGGGVALVDSALRIDFGRAEASAVASMTKLVGRPETARGGCVGSDASYAEWPDGTRLVFVGGAFSGWEGDGAQAGALCQTARQRS